MLSHMEGMPVLIRGSLRLVVAVLAMVMIGACLGSNATTPAPSSAAAASLAPSSAPSAGASAAQGAADPASVEPSSAATEFVAGGDRPVTVHVPAGVDPTGAPLLLILHGYSSSGAEMTSWLPLGDAAGRRGIVWAYPDGSPDERGLRFWNATDACCGFGSTIDDVAYLTGLIDEIAARTRIDPGRVYVAGHSNGGFMSHRMACDRSDKVTAIASISGVTFADPSRCSPSEPVGILQVHGTEDQTLHFGGGVLQVPGIPDAPYPGAADSARLWLGLDGCDAALTETTRRIDAVAGVDAAGDPAETTVAESTGCDRGGRVELWTMLGVGHVPAFSSAFPDAVLDFLLAQNRA